MKIISKYKDYYDYLLGIYGIDEKLMLDRTEFMVTPIRHEWNNYSVVKLVICGWLVEGLYLDGRFLYGKELEPYSSLPKRKYKWQSSYVDPDHYYIEYENQKSSMGNYDRSGSITINKKPIFLENSPNDKYDCPILYKKEMWRDDEYIKHPILRDYMIGKVFSPEEIWIMLSNWLSREKVIEDKQTDKEKIVSKGFDLKTSFRKR